MQVLIEILKEKKTSVPRELYAEVLGEKGSNVTNFLPLVVHELDVTK